jgi:hypothetical protein
LIEMNTTHIELQLVQNNVQIIVQLTALSKELILCYNSLLTGKLGAQRVIYPCAAICYNLSLAATKP